jgi:hypothetical protein
MSLLRKRLELGFAKRFDFAMRKLRFYCPMGNKSFRAMLKGASL